MCSSISSTPRLFLPDPTQSCLTCHRSRIPVFMSSSLQRSKIVRSEGHLISGMGMRQVQTHASKLAAEVFDLKMKLHLEKQRSEKLADELENAEKNCNGLKDGFKTLSDRLKKTEDTIAKLYAVTEAQADTLHEARCINESYQERCMELAGTVEEAIERKAKQIPSPNSSYDAAPFWKDTAYRSYSDIANPELISIYTRDGRFEHSTVHPPRKMKSMSHVYSVPSQNSTSHSSHLHADNLPEPSESDFHSMYRMRGSQQGRSSESWPVMAEPTTDPLSSEARLRNTISQSKNAKIFFANARNGLNNIHIPKCSADYDKVDSFTASNCEVPNEHGAYVVEARFREPPYEGMLTPVSGSFRNSDVCSYLSDDLTSDIWIEQANGTTHSDPRSPHKSISKRNKHLEVHRRSLPGSLVTRPRLHQPGRTHGSQLRRTPKNPYAGTKQPSGVSFKESDRRTHKSLGGFRGATISRNRNAATSSRQSLEARDSTEPRPSFVKSFAGLVSSRFWPIIGRRKPQIIIPKKQQRSSDAYIPGRTMTESAGPSFEQ